MGSLNSQLTNSGSEVTEWKAGNKSARLHKGIKRARKIHSYHGVEKRN